MFNFFKNLFKGKQQEKAPESIQEKVDAPVACGCGRSPTGYCVGLHALSESEWDQHPDNPLKGTLAAAEKKITAVKDIAEAVNKTEIKFPKSPAVKTTGRKTNTAKPVEAKKPIETKKPTESKKPVEAKKPRGRKPGAQNKAK